MADIDQARDLAEGLLAQHLPRRWRHVIGVVDRAHELTDMDASANDLLVAAAWLHDVGYSPLIPDTGFHALDGARHLRAIGFDERVTNLVAHHSCAAIRAAQQGFEEKLATEFPFDPSLPHDELCYCDQTTSPDGEVVDVIERRAEVRRRLGRRHDDDRLDTAVIACVERVSNRHRVLTAHSRAELAGR